MTKLNSGEPHFKQHIIGCKSKETATAVSEPLFIFQPELHAAISKRGRIIDRKWVIITISRIFDQLTILSAKEYPGCYAHTKAISNIYKTADQVFTKVTQSLTYLFGLNH